MIIVRVVLNIAIAVLAFAIGALATPALAQTWPSRPVHVVVSSGAGGTADVLARIVGDRVSQALGHHSATPISSSNTASVSGGSAGSNLRW